MRPKPGTRHQAPGTRHQASGIGHRASGIGVRGSGFGVRVQVQGATTGSEKWLALIFVHSYISGARY
ncbi:MAG: hypothetical protein EOM92_10750 [Gammaproteobacteria bacterium]|nr:hypothetical protein [Gammaproteobacteria bacterium]